MIFCGNHLVVMAIRKTHTPVSFSKVGLRSCATCMSLWISVYIIVVGCFAPVSSQPGFLSIDCGSNENYTDDATGIFWQTDAEYISTGRNIGGIEGPDNDFVYNFRRQLSTVRYFDDSRPARNRDCYVLPTKPRQKYLIRLTLLYNGWVTSIGNTSTTFVFDIYLNSTIFKTFNSEFSLIGFDFSEILFHSTGSIVSLCLIRRQGPSFLSSVELRELGNGMYDYISQTGDSGVRNFLQYLVRVDLGAPNSSFQRYPADPYDRLWETWSTSDDIFKHPYTDIQNRNISGSTSPLAPELPPHVVMETAWVSYNFRVLTLATDQGALVGHSYLVLYCQELDGNSSATNVRGMDLTVNGNFFSALNCSSRVSEAKGLVGGSNATVVYNITAVQKSWSLLPPMLNAGELLEVKKFTTSETAQSDVEAVSALATRVTTLPNSKGDPCLPIPFFWLGCTTDAVDPQIFRVTSLELVNFSITGSFPPELFMFKNLSTLSLSQNNITGFIPNLAALPLLQNLSLSDNRFEGNIQGLSSLVNLRSLYLENNLLTGSVPDFLASRHLTELHLDNNNFSGNIPVGLTSDQGLNLTYTNNPGLRRKASSHDNFNVGALVGGLVGGTIGFITLASIIFLIATRKRRATSRIIKNIRKAGSGEGQEQGSRGLAPHTPGLSVAGSPTFGSLRVFSLQQVSDATEKFSRKIGEGSFGPVYHGRLPNSGQEVAAKVKSGYSRQGLTEFRNELDLLSRIHHRNLVSLVGYCEEADQQVLIYAYLSNGSLRDHLYGNKSKQPLDWKTRLDIAVSSSTGLEYLHFHCYPRIIHRDVKSANILLDKNMHAKVSDFGISRPTMEGMTSGVDTRIMGTPGYIDPEYYISQLLTQKSDVYSFGVVLLEIISGCRPYLGERDDNRPLSLVEWARDSVRDGNAADLFDRSLDNNFNYQSARMVLDLALQCTIPTTSSRPDMQQVARRLVEAAQLEKNDVSRAIPSTEPLEHQLVMDDRDVSPSAQDLGEDMTDSLRRSGSVSQFGFPTNQSDTVLSNDRPTLHPR